MIPCDLVRGTRGLWGLGRGILSSICGMGYMEVTRGSAWVCAGNDEGPVCELRGPEGAGDVRRVAARAAAGSHSGAPACAEEVHVWQAHRGKGGEAGGCWR